MINLMLEITEPDPSLFSSADSPNLAAEISSLSPEQLEQVINSAFVTLAGGDFAQRWELAKTLPQLGTGIIPRLTAILADEDEEEELQWFAIKILASFPHPDAWQTLTEVLQTQENDDLREAAVDALSQFGSSAVTLAAELASVPESEAIAVEILASLQCGERVEPLLTLAQTAEPTVKAKAIEALSVIEDERIEPILWKAVGDYVAGVRREALIGLGLIATRYHLQQQEVKLAGFVDKILPCLYDFSVSVCEQAAMTLGRVKTVPAAEGLFAVLMKETTPISLQVKIVNVLGWMEMPEAISYLGEALATSLAKGEERLMVTQEIIHVLGRIRQPDLKGLAVNLLIEVIETNSLNDRLQAMAILGLGQLGDPQAAEILQRLQSHPNPQISLHAQAALKQLL